MKTLEEALGNIVSSERQYLTDRVNQLAKQAIEKDVEIESLELIREAAIAVANAHFESSSDEHEAIANLRNQILRHSHRSLDTRLKLVGAK